MRKHRWLSALICIGCSGAIAAAASAKVALFSCKYEVENRGTAGWATVKVVGGEVQKVDFDDFYKSFPGRPGYQCGIGASRDDKETKWSRKGRSIEVEFVDAPRYNDGSSMLILRTSNGILLDMSNAKNTYCGAGASLPKSVLVPFASKKCVVKFWDYR